MGRNRERLAVAVLAVGVLLAAASLPLARCLDDETQLGGHGRVLQKENKASDEAALQREAAAAGQGGADGARGGMLGNEQPGGETHMTGKKGGNAKKPSFEAAAEAAAAQQQQQQEGQWQGQAGGAAAAAAAAAGGERETFPEWVEDARRGEKYLVFQTCKGYCNQLEAFVEGAAIAHLLNLTLVIPQWYAHYDHALLGRYDFASVGMDPQAAHAVPMSHFWDIGALKAGLEGVVRVADALPPYLGRANTSLPFVPSVEVDHARPATLTAYRTALRHSRVLRLHCPLVHVLFTTKDMGTIRRRVLLSLKPSHHIAEAAAKQVQRFEEAAGAGGGAAARALQEAGGAGAQRQEQHQQHQHQHQHQLQQAQAQAQALQAPAKYLGLHLRTEVDWYIYCRKEAQRTAQSWVESFEQCYQHSDDLARLINGLGLARQYLRLYVASGNFTEADAQTLLTAGFEVVMSNTLTCRKGEKRCTTYPLAKAGHEVLAAIDFQMMMGADFFLGNVFSSFSATIRMSRLVAIDPVAQLSDTVYYNMPLNFSAGELRPLETRRFGVRAGVLFRDIYDKPGAREAWAHRVRAHAEGRCLHKHQDGPRCHGRAEVPPVLSVRLLQATPSPQSNWLQLEGTAQLGSGHWYPQVEVLVDNSTRKGVILANIQGRLDKPTTVSFRSQVPIRAARNVSVHVSVCSTHGARVCSEGLWVDLRPPLATEPRPDAAPVVYVRFPGLLKSGGPESLHLIHQHINKWYSKGEIAVRSVFPGGQEFYRGVYSNFTGDNMYPETLTPSDYVLFPEKASKLEPWWPSVLEQTGAVPMAFYLGQHHEALHDSRTTVPFKKICITSYAAATYGCASGATLNPPMNRSFTEAADEFFAGGGLARKENIVIVDPDDNNYLDITRIQLPPGASMYMLHGWTRQEMVELYKKSKVLVDSYLTGRERPVFESSLFGVVPIFATHANGLQLHDYPIPRAWQWAPFDYDRLNELIARALADHATAFHELSGMRDHVRAMVDVFTLRVWRYFQDDVHVVVPALSDDPDLVVGPHVSRAIAAYLVVRTIYPFSTQEILSRSPQWVHSHYASVLDALKDAGALFDVTSSTLWSEHIRFGAMAGYVQRPQAQHFRQFVLLLPPGQVPIHADLAAALFGTALRTGAAVVAGPTGVLLVRAADYYPALARALPLLPSRLSVDDILAAVEGAGLPVERLPTVYKPLPGGRQYEASCDVVLLPPAADAARHSACFCPALLEAMRGPLWARYARVAAALREEAIADFNRLKAEFCQVN